MMQPGKKLAFKLVLSVSFVTATIFLVMLAYNYRISRKLLDENIRENVSHITRYAVNRIEGVLISAMTIPENLAVLVGDFNYTEAEIRQFLKKVVQHNDEIIGSCLAFEPYAFDPDEKYFAPYYYKAGDSVRYENLGTGEYDYFFWDWYQIPARLNTPVWSEPYFDEGGANVVMTTYSVPFYKDGDLAGIATVDVSLEWLKAYISRIKILETGYAFVISRNGRIISHPADSLIMNESIFSLAEENNDPEIRKAGKAMIRGESDYIPFPSLILDEKAYLYYRPLPATGWSLAVVLSEEALLADLHRLNRDLLIIGIAGIFLLVLSVVVISNRITHPLRKLASATVRIGRGNFDVELPVNRSDDEIGQLNASICRMQQELKTYVENLRTATAAREKIESELKIARDIQQGIIPKIFPPFPDRKDLDVYAVLEPARDVGGDLYDFFFIDDRHLCFAIGDVSGKGIPASLMMAITRTLLRARVTRLERPETIVALMNRELCRDNDKAMFVTMFLGIIDLDSGTISYCNAGHNYPCLVRKGKALEKLDQTHGTPLGSFEKMSYGSGSVRFCAGDLLVLYTDGVTEAMDINDALYGEERLVRFLKSKSFEGPEEVTLSLVEDVREFSGLAEQSDDITILAIQHQ
ncbi:MAG: SpoIIE family protein phosphatase [Bacteroidales bacterium]